MGRIKKTATARHQATMCDYVRDFVKSVEEIPMIDLPTKLREFPHPWPFLRGDLYHWIPVLNRFDDILETFVKEYNLDAGPQLVEFGSSMLEKAHNLEEAKRSFTDHLQSRVPYGKSADVGLIECILQFTRMLLDNCGNRSLYNSSSLLNSLLHTTDLSLLKETLLLCYRLAVRYSVSRMRYSSVQVQNSTLANHYAISLDRMHTLAQPFAKGMSWNENGHTSKKGKEKAHHRKGSMQSKISSGDLVEMLREDAMVAQVQQEFGSVTFQYYEEGGEQPNRLAADREAVPTTPTPARRSSNLNPQTQHAHRPSRSGDECSGLPLNEGEVASPSGLHQVNITYRDLMQSNSLPKVLSLGDIGFSRLPDDERYELFHRVRVAFSMARNRSDREDIIAVRLLAIANIAYIHPEPVFQQKIGQADSDEPRRLQLAYQLAELVHPPGPNDQPISTELQTFVLITLESLLKHKSKAQDVSTALSTNVNHGILFYILRKVVAILGSEKAIETPVREWLDAVFNLLHTLPIVPPRIGECMVSAGLFDIFVDIINLRTNKAERYQDRIFNWMDSYVYTIRDAFQSLVNAKGLDATADFTAHEVASAFAQAQSGKGVPQNYRSKVTDFDISFAKQQNLRWVFKFISHMLTHSSGNFDRLLRNLIDSPQLLQGLRTVLSNARIFGSNIWSSAVHILSSFIHNEPTSYAVIAEAGLSKAFLESIVQHPVDDADTPMQNNDNNEGQKPGQSTDSSHVGVQTFSSTETQKRSANAVGILPSAEAITAIPTAFGAICLNENGMKLFKNSGALEVFFKIYLSPEHVQALDEEIDAANTIGLSFDELTRHHPSLKNYVFQVMRDMIVQVVNFCYDRAKNGAGAKLWVEEDGQLWVAGGAKALLGETFHRVLKVEETKGFPDLVDDSEVNQSDVDSLARTPFVGGQNIKADYPTDNKPMSINATSEMEENSDTVSPAVFISVACRFLSGLFSNPSCCAAFIEAGGLDFVLDFATLPCLSYNFNDLTSPHHEDVARVVSFLVEQKPFLALPSLIRRAIVALEDLEPLLSHEGGVAFFEPYTKRGDAAPTQSNTCGINDDGTKYVKALVMVHNICGVFSASLQAQMYGHRSNHTVFSQINFADMYCQMISALGKLQRSCVWEEILLQQTTPKHWDRATRVKSYSEEADRILGLAADVPAIDGENREQSGEQEGQSSSSTQDPARQPSISQQEKDSAAFKNTQILRYLLGRIPTSIIPVLGCLGKMILARRQPDSYQKQNAMMVADEIAKTACAQLQFGPAKDSLSVKDRYSYLIVILSTISQLMIDTQDALDRPIQPTLTAVLQAFKDRRGLSALSDCLDTFHHEASLITQRKTGSQQETDSEMDALLNLSLGGMKIILSFFSQLAHGKAIHDAPQTSALATRDRDRERADFFQTSQFIVEIRHSIVGPVRKLWESPLMDNATTSIVKTIVRIMQCIFDAEHEVGALKRSEKQPTRQKMVPKKWRGPANDTFENLKNDKYKYDDDLIREALFRCNNQQHAAREYCRAQRTQPRMVRNPIPPTELSSPRPLPPSESTSSVPSAPSETPAQYSVAADPLIQTESSDNETSAVGEGSDGDNQGLPASLSVSGEPFGPMLLSALDSQRSSPVPPAPASRPPPENAKVAEWITIDDLDDERADLRSQLIERSLDILNVHDDVTFELADLISAAVHKAPDPDGLRGDISSTLISSLISLNTGDDLRSEGKKIAAYSHLLGLNIQDPAFFRASLNELQLNIGNLIDFVRAYPAQQAENSVQWIGKVLLVVECLLREDQQPKMIRWSPPPANGDNTRPESPIIEAADPVVWYDNQSRLLEAILEILPKIGKDESLALSVVRVLVILTRNRNLAMRLGQKRNIQRLFLMIRQLSGATNEKLQGSFLLILRHIIEDEETVRQVMRSEIQAMFEGRQRGQTDTTSFTRQAFHLVLRNPEIFVEVVNEKLMLARYEPNQRPQLLVLKKEENKFNQPSAESSDQTGAPSESKDKTEAVEESTSPDEAEKTEDEQKGKTHEHKFPFVENPEGVIHYLLCELLAYKDVEDKDVSATRKEPQKEETPMDVEMTNGDDHSTSAGSPPPPVEQKKFEKPEFKPEDHPIYMYRCFVLQCLSELLSCYNRCKVEFINFRRKHDPHTTPSKPRSVILNYLLTTLIPVGSLGHAETTDLPARKKYSTSNWAISVITGLCSRTQERGASKSNDPKESEDEPELFYSRKLVLDCCLKAIKDAHGSSEPAEMRYSRLLCLADLLSRMLTSKPLGNPSMTHMEGLQGSQKQLARLMYEKHFIPTFDSALADIDVNYPNAKRAIKYLLRPLSFLTQTAVDSSNSATSASGSAEEDASSSASSISLDDDREETPDLFRNSTLGMFEPGRGEESESESDEEDDDEDMYDQEEYGSDVYLEDEEMGEGEEPSSDDEEIAGVGPIEGVPGDEGFNMEIVIDEDGQDDSEDEDEDDSEDESGDEGGDDMEDMEEEVEQSGDGDDEEWYSDDEEEDDLDMPADYEENRADPAETGIDDIVRALGNGPPGLIQRLDEAGLDIDGDPEFVEEEDVDDDEEEEEIYDDDDVMYDAGFDGEFETWFWNPPRARNLLTIFTDDDELMSANGWTAVDDSPFPGRIPHHHHHHHGHPRNPFTFPPHLVPSYRSRGMPNHGPSRAQDDGTNPLLSRERRDGPNAAGRPELASDWVHAMGGALGPGRMGVHLGPADGNPASLISNLINAIASGNGPRDLLDRDHPMEVFLGGIDGPMGPTALSAQIRTHRGRSMDVQSRATREDPVQATAFTTQSTVPRWIEEARLLYGQHAYEKSQRIINSILKVLVPPAIEAAKVRAAEAAERERKRREEQEAAEAKARQEREEREERERKEREERQAAEREAAAAREREREREEAERVAAEQAGSDDQDSGEHMEGVEPVQPTASAAEQQTQTEPERPAAMVTLRGQEINISSLGIDPEYLEALPEELREDVVLNQVAEQRSQAAAAGQEPSDISREFLAALPADIRDELLQQEAQDRRRREREEARRRAAVNAPPENRAEDMDAANFLASLDPNLRQAVLMEQDDDVLAHLPREIADEARALGGDRRLHQAPDTGGEYVIGNPIRRERAEDHGQKKKPRQAIQFMDKAGVSSMVRLLFTLPQGSTKGFLNTILRNLCENRQSRAEVISLLLQILQEGSSDMSAIERSFTQITHKARQPRQALSHKSPVQSKHASERIAVPEEVSPFAIVQQCLNALIFLNNANPHISSFFLTEHEMSRAAQKKGKEKASKTNKFPLNALLNLLDRSVIIESASVMENLALLLQEITSPLTNLLKKDKEKPTDDKQDKPTEAPEGNDTEMVEAGDNAEQPETGEGAAAESSEPKGKDKAADKAEEKKKARTMVPPDVPEKNLRLVVNIFSARECNNKTFTNTLTVINNLSAIPGAKEVFGRELINQSQDLGEAILKDLEHLCTSVSKAKTATDVQGMALSKFAPPSSDQAKLLRVITGLDYLFDPKRANAPDAPSSTGVTGMDSQQREDILSTLYENPTFGALWNKLSECLTAIRQRGNMFNVATILLPLIEVLMVVCKNTTLKDVPLSGAQPAQGQIVMSTPPPESRMESLFFKFTEDHRKILNDLVRHNPRLMSGSFDLLVKNSKVLEFDNKRNYFHRKLHNRSSEVRHPHPPLQLSVRRENVFLDSYRSLFFKKGDEMKYGKLSIRFHGEEGVDAGGVTREWFQVLSRQMFDPNYALFIPVASDRTTFHPNKDSAINAEHLQYFKFIGRILGKALYENRVLDCHFSRAVYKRILGKPVSIKDMETLDLDYYKSLLWMLENDITDVITETFSIEHEAFGETQVIDLVENGHTIPVTEDNKQDYVRLVVEYKLTGSVQEQLKHFLEGFHEIIPAELISIFNEQELELLISGLPDIDVDDWKNNTEYHNYTAASPQIQWFWRAVRSFDKEERAKLLQFVTGTSKVPLNGFGELEGMNGFSRFNIHRDYGSKDRLPSSHTCFNQLDLPEYESYESLRQQLYTAMTAGSEYFGFA
ncbi:hypothetical protein BDY21DRAFT_166279 [Lineolata rhizophorae]|uniref:HECT-type E3 ubiquitin transferase n=1 Tax=Lineolata rhizophorae TaxID=578093 RepID=A0A6A6PAP1_9PEZI|nr:hypothetical protein BDY21DRAFT_166279 [Lineolata rhizophorae]